MSLIDLVDYFEEKGALTNDYLKVIHDRIDSLLDIGYRSIKNELSIIQGLISNGSFDDRLNFYELFGKEVLKNAEEHNHLTLLHKKFLFKVKSGLDKEIKEELLVVPETLFMFYLAHFGFNKEYLPYIDEIDRLSKLFQ
jgi:hypothetical protein